VIDDSLRAFVDHTVDRIHACIPSLTPPAGYALIIKTVSAMATVLRGHNPRRVLLIDLSWAPSGEGRGVRCGIVLTSNDFDRCPSTLARIDLLTNKLDAARLSMLACFQRDIEGVPA
jgi:hypothetical protein